MKNFSTFFEKTCTFRRKNASIQVKNEKQEEPPVKKRNLIKIICAAMLCALLAGALVGCSLKKQETVTVYPCYFNDDVAGMDAATIGASRATG